MDTQSTRRAGAKGGRLVLALVAMITASVTGASAMADTLYVLASRSTLVKTGAAMGEVIIADPSVADVHAHGTNYLSVIGKRPGQTTLRLFDKNRKLLRSYDVAVGYDLVAVRRALANFLPDESIGVEMVNTNIALTGQVSSATSADKAVRIVSEFLKQMGVPAASAPEPTPQSGEGVQNAALASAPGVLNLLQVTSGQQVMLRVRVGEIQRDALHRLGIDPRVSVTSGSFFTQLALGATQYGLTAGAAGDYQLPDGQFHGSSTLGWRNNSGDQAWGLIKALERDGLFKLLAEPNLVAVSGEQAEFLAGGEIPIPVPQTTGSAGSNTLTIEYKPFGVAVRFKPFVLSENRIRMEVQPEVSELDYSNAVTLNNFRVPAISTRRAKTTVELAPGESFMIAGLIKDQVRSSIDQLPGVKELPILGALFRSTDFQRNETELVIAITPYIVDPVKGADVKLPTDNFAPASQMETFFYGALGTMSGDIPRISQTPSVEGPIGFMVD